MMWIVEIIVLFELNNYLLFNCFFNVENDIVSQQEMFQTTQLQIIFFVAELNSKEKIFLIPLSEYFKYFLLTLYFLKL